MRPFYENFPFFCIYIALIGGVVTTVLRKGRVARVLSFIVLLSCAVLSGAVAVMTAASGKAFTYSMGEFPAPWGNEIRSGPVEAMLACVFSLVMIGSLLGGKEDLKHDLTEGKQNLYYLMVDFLAASLYVLCYTNDVFTGYVFIEINTIAACTIVVAKDSGQTILATIRYLIMSLVGSGVYLFGISMLYTITGHLLMPNLFSEVRILIATGAYHYPLAVVCGMILVGLAVKSALFPFHTWLPTAHGSATTASSAMLSGVVLKGYIILLIKIMCRVFAPFEVAHLHAGSILLVLGAGAMIYGSIQAVREPHAKRMIAFSSVAQVGYIYLGLGLCTEAGIAAAVFQIVAHAFAKPLLFISAGGLINASGHQKKLYFLRGAARRCPAAGIGFTVGGLSMVGIPLFAGFVTKVVLTQAALDVELPLWQMIVALAAIAISSLLNAWYYIPAILQIWKGGEAEMPAVESAANGATNAPAAEDVPASPATGSVMASPAQSIWQPDLSFRLAVYGMSVFVILLGCLAVPVMKLITDGVALL